MRRRRRPEAGRSRPRHGAPAATERLTDRLRAQTDGFRKQLALDVARARALAEDGRAAEAAEAVDAPRKSLEELRTALETVLADAAVEREAEAVVAGAAGRRRLDRGESRLRLAIASITLVLVAVLAAVPLLTREPVPTLSAADAQAAAVQLAAARAQLDALQSDGAASGSAIAEQVRALHATIRALPRKVLGEADAREALRDILQREQEALSELVGHVPEAETLLDESRVLRDSLALDVAPTVAPPLPEAPTSPPPVAPVAPPDADAPDVPAPDEPAGLAP